MLSAIGIQIKEKVDASVQVSANSEMESQVKKAGGQKLRKNEEVERIPGLVQLCN